MAGEIDFYRPFYLFDMMFIKSIVYTVRYFILKIISQDSSLWHRLCIFDAIIVSELLPKIIHVNNP